MQIISIRKQPEFLERAIAYFQQSWPDIPAIIYDDCIRHAVYGTQALPQWYLLIEGTSIIGCAGLITNDFISRMDLYPWLCALYIEESHRGKNLAKLLIERTKKDSDDAGFKQVYLCTELVGYYEKQGFSYIGKGYHPWGEESRIYGIDVNG